MAAKNYKMTRQTISQIMSHRRREVGLRLKWKIIKQVIKFMKFLSSLILDLANFFIVCCNETSLNNYNFHSRGLDSNQLILNHVDAQFFKV